MSMIATMILALATQTKTPTAAELIQAVEKKAADAKSVRWKATMRVGADELATECWFQGAAFRCIAKGRMGGRDTDLLIVCDGATLVSADGPKQHRQAAGKDAAARFRTSFLRTGALGSIFAGDGGIPDDWSPELKDATFEEDAKIDGRTMRVVSCKIAMGNAPTFSQKLWIDAEKQVLVKRSVEGLGGVAVEETFSGVAFDEALDAGLFKLP